MNRPSGQSNENQALWRTFQQGVGKRNRAGCLSTDQFASYLDRKTSLEATNAIEEHLAVCPVCLSAVRETRALIADVGQPVPGLVVERAQGLVVSGLREEQSNPWETLREGLRGLFQLPLEGLAYVMLMVLVGTIALNVGAGTYLNLFSAEGKAAATFLSPLGEGMETQVGGGL